MIEGQFPEAEVRSSKQPSVIWLLPLIAVAVAGWLLTETWLQKPTKIWIDFPSGTGIEVGETKIMYEGLVAGAVSDLQLDMSDMEGVVVEAAINHRMASLLTKGTQFWLVKPEVSLRGISGLETIVTGNYIAMKPSGEGRRAAQFKALSTPPSFDIDQPGLNIFLRSDTLGSISIGSPILYKKIQVGEVLGYSLSEAGDEVLINVNIEPKFSALIKPETRFWNISGFSAKASLSGVEVSTSSLASILQGGITFDSPSDSEPAVADGAIYDLYTSADSAQRTIGISILLPPPMVGLRQGMPILHQGQRIGRIESLQSASSGEQIIATAEVEPAAEFVLTDQSEFFLVKPQLSLSQLSEIDKLITGPHIMVRARSGEPSSEFIAQQGPPPITTADPGLQLKLSAEHMGSVGPGTTIFYRQVPVGQVESVGLRPNYDGVEALITIHEPYARLVTTNTRFWNASGIQVEGSLAGVRVDAESLLSIISGGIAFYNPTGKGSSATEGAHFTLYDNRQLAEESGIMVRLNAPNGYGLQPGTQVKYQGFVIGAVKSVELKPDLSGVQAQVLLREQGRKFAVQGSRFWLVGPSVGTDGVEHLDTLVTGQFLQVAPGAEGRSRYEFNLLAAAPRLSEASLALTLTAPRLSSIRTGLKVRYRDVVVGEVTGHRLAPTADRVLIDISIDAPYHRLVRRGTRFWNTSGVDVDFGWFTGAEVRVESVETLLLGGISFATPDEGERLPEVAAGTVFKLSSKPDKEWLQWSPAIQLYPN